MSLLAPLDPHARRFLDMLAATDHGGSATLRPDARRRAFANLMRFTRAPTTEVQTRDFWIGPEGGLLVRVYNPSAARGPGLLYCHGGGLVSGSVETHDAFCRSLAADSDCHLVAVDYLLAPEHPYPAAIDDCRMAWEWIHANAGVLKLDSDRIGIGGDSAGGTLAALLCGMVRPRAAFQILLCPITDFSAKTASRERLATGFLLDQATMDHDIALYAPDLDPSDPRVSPLKAGQFEDLPPALIHTAGYDPLCDEGRAYADALREAGVAVSLTDHPGMIHLFYAFTGILPYARKTMPAIGAEIGAWARR